MERKPNFFFFFFLLAALRRAKLQAKLQGRCWPVGRIDRSFVLKGAERVTARPRSTRICITRANRQERRPIRESVRSRTRKVISRSYLRRGKASIRHPHTARSRVTDDEIFSRHDERTDAREKDSCALSRFDELGVAARIARNYSLPIKFVDTFVDSGTLVLSYSLKLNQRKCH